MVEVCILAYLRRKDIIRGQGDNGIYRLAFEKPKSIKPIRPHQMSKIVSYLTLLGLETYRWTKDQFSITNNYRIIENC